MAFVVEQLRASGFLVQILPPPHVCVVYISWDPNELKPAPKRPALEHGKETHKPDKKQLRLTNGKYF